MHTRRFGAFITGMWLMGAILMWFSSSQATLSVERIFNNPPSQIQKEIADMGPDVARQVFRYQSSIFITRVQETWEVIQLGLLGALLATSILTAHRSRVVVGATVLMMICVAIQAFQLTPLMSSLARAYDFLPATAAIRERESFANFKIWHRVLDVFKAILALAIVSRLLFDFYDFGSAVPWTRASKRRRRSRRSGAARSPSGTAAVPEVSGPAVLSEDGVDTVGSEQANPVRPAREND